MDRGEKKGKSEREGEGDYIGRNNKIMIWSKKV